MSRRRPVRNRREAAALRYLHRLPAGTVCGARTLTRALAPLRRRFLREYARHMDAALWAAPGTAPAVWTPGQVTE